MDILEKQCLFGEIFALIRKKDLNPDNIQVFVIDECDKMLSVLGKKKYL